MTSKCVTPGKSRSFDKMRQAIPIDYCWPQMHIVNSEILLRSENVKSCFKCPQTNQRSNSLKQSQGLN